MKHSRISSKTLLLSVPVVISIALISVGVYAYRVRREAVLLHMLADADCACGDYHEEVTGLVILNPFRDQAPERAALSFFERLRKGQCQTTPPDVVLDAQLCRYALDGHRVSNWKLMNRQDQDQNVVLYYKLTKLGAENEPHRNLTGEGAVGVTKIGGTWTVTGYSSYF
jgi:hypothetical protein